MAASTKKKRSGDGEDTEDEVDGAGASGTESPDADVGAGTEDGDPDFAVSAALARISGTPANRAGGQSAAAPGTPRSPVVPPFSPSAAPPRIASGNSGNFSDAGNTGGAAAPPSSPDDVFSAPFAPAASVEPSPVPDAPAPRPRRRAAPRNSSAPDSSSAPRSRVPGGNGDPQDPWMPILAASLALGALLLVIALFAYKSDQAFFFSDPRGLLSSLGAQHPLDGVNPIGSLGATLAILLFGIAGLGAFFVPACLVVSAIFCMCRRHPAGRLFPWRILYMLLTFLTLVTLLARFNPAAGMGNGFSVLSWLGFLDFVRKGLGGTLGDLLYNDVAGHIFGETGSLVLLLILNTFCAAGILVNEPVRKSRQLIHDTYVWLKVFLAKPMPPLPRPASRAPAPPRIGAEEEKQNATAAPAPQSGAPRAIHDTEDTAATLSAAEPATAGQDSFDDYALPAEEELPALNGDDLRELAAVIEAAQAPAAAVTAAAAAAAETAEDAAAATAPGASSGATANPNRPASLSPATPPPRRPPPAGTLRILEEETVERAAHTAAPKKRGGYQFPPVALLSEPPPVQDNSAQEDYAGRAARLLTTLSEFKIKAEMGDIQSGPVITRYEVIPAPGVKVEKIAGLANNLAMNLKAESVRVLAPVPGKGTVGIEVPNQKAKAVSLREIIESKAWENSKAEIPVVLGKDVTGKPIIENLAKMPHCLIAGSTGSGKSVCINGIVASLIYHAGPDELRFIMVDPKVVELQIYNKLPHMLIPVVTEPKKVPAALKYLISEMTKRYKYFAKKGVKNIVGFNTKITRENRLAEMERQVERQNENQLDFELTPEERVASAAATATAMDDGEDIPMPTAKLPYIICFIDELADLMMVAPADIETGIARLAQLARAAGIHLILATQRPSVNVITGIIKANLPTRIAFKVTSLMDSRTILDQKGAETLIGRGDMLFIPPGGSHLVRAQGAYVSEEEIEAIVNHISLCNGEPEFDDDAQDMIERLAAEDAEDDDDGQPTEGTGEFDDEDPVLSKAWSLISATKKASTSFLQRKLSIGYGRAAKIMDTLEAKGYIGPDKGPGNPRDILHE